MNRKRLIALAPALVVIGALFYFYAGHQTPAGQPPLAELTDANFATLADTFNGAKDDVRVILLLSPT